MNGSSPLTRGKRYLTDCAIRTMGLIPAHAGKTCASIAPRKWPAAHPRSRGENTRAPIMEVLAVGSSPLTRGKPKAVSTLARKHGLIPAHAGKTVRDGPYRAGDRAHPRSRGENPLADARARVFGGSSPLTRGKLLSVGESNPVEGLIPAHAGKTRSRFCGHLAPAAHPRSRGENSARAFASADEDGSSPLTRGKPHARGRPGNRGRLIPAHAGKTLPDLRFYCADRSDLGNP